MQCSADPERTGTSIVPMLSLVALVLMSGCGVVSEPDRACTEIGCSDGLIVDLQVRPPVSFRVEVRSPTSSSVQIVDCPNPTSCGSSVFFDGYTPVEATVTVVVAGREPVTRTVQPAYTISQPNGKNCEPRCRQAIVLMALSA